MQPHYSGCQQTDAAFRQALKFGHSPELHRGGQVRDLGRCGRSTNPPHTQVTLTHKRGNKAIICHLFTRPLIPDKSASGNTDIQQTANLKLYHGNSQSSQTGADRPSCPARHPASHPRRPPHQGPGPGPGPGPRP